MCSIKNSIKNSIAKGMLRILVFLLLGGFANLTPLYFSGMSRINPIENFTQGPLESLEEPTAFQENLFGLGLLINLLTGLGMLFTLGQLGLLLYQEVMSFLEDKIDQIFPEE